jgi:hypothetical protein
MCSLIVFKHIEKTGGTSIMDWFHRLARRGELCYHSGWFPYNAHCAVCRADEASNHGNKWTRRCNCDRHAERQYILSQFENRVGKGDLRPFWTFRNDSTPRPWKAVIEIHGHDSDLQSILRRIELIKTANAQTNDCEIHTLTVFRHPVAHWMSRYAYYVRRGFMHLKHGDPLPPLLEWVRENPNDQTHDLLRGQRLIRGLPRVRGDDYWLYVHAMDTLKHFDMPIVIEQLPSLPPALCGILQIRRNACEHIPQSNVRKGQIPDPLKTGLPTDAQWRNLTRRYGGVDERLYEYVLSLQALRHFAQ